MWKNTSPLKKSVDFMCLWRHSKEEPDLLAYRQQCRSVSMQLPEAKRDYYYTKVEASNNDQKSFFDITKKFLVN